jgi:hypothetical protein
VKRVSMLRDQARLLRDVAAKSSEHPELYLKLLAIAAECDRLAESFAETLGPAGAPPERRPSSH